MAISTTLWDSIDAADTDPMHASEARPALHATPSVKMSYHQWTERLIVHPPLVTARELAGLPDERLAALAAQYEQTPRKVQTVWLKAGAAASVVVLALGVALGTLREADDTTLATMAFGFVLTGAVGASLAGWLFYVNGSLGQGHRRLGLLVSALDEQHPWLYRTLLLLQHPPVEAYRAQTLAERGLLRGVDYLLMREIAQVHERLLLTQKASAVVKQLQGEALGARRAAPALEPFAQAAPATQAAQGALGAQVLQGAPESSVAPEGGQPSRVTLTPLAA